MKILRNIIIGSSLAVTLALITSVQAADVTAKGGASGLMELKPIKTSEDVTALKAGDQVIMACPKCKSMYVTRIIKENKPGKTSEVATTEHLCPGCGNQIALKGHGKAAKEQITHVCKQCGSKDAFCCVLKAGEGATKGMEKPTR